MNTEGIIKANEYHYDSYLTAKDRFDKKLEEIIEKLKSSDYSTDSLLRDYSDLKAISIQMSIFPTL